ncbi:hypothetical protein [uncultured Fibrobacter sp.]|nr:hypothetical protein [uncultured Fibrobacter sp.]
MRQETSVNKIKHYDPEQMYEVSEEKVVTNWVQDVKVPNSCYSKDSCQY